VIPTSLHRTPHVPIAVSNNTIVIENRNGRGRTFVRSTLDL
jgi:hypothetical protein